MYMISKLMETGINISEKESKEEKQLDIHSKRCWVVSTQIWVKYGQTQMLG